VSAKRWLSNGDEVSPVTVVCTLVSGDTTLDETDVTVPPAGAAAVPLGATTTFEEDGGGIVVSCSDGGAGTAAAHDVKMTAIRIGALH
jgi:hypothetical protein